MEPEKLNRVRRIVSGELDLKDPSGFGLFNIQQRLRLNYGPEYGLALDSVYGEWTEVQAVIPAEDIEDMA